MTRGHQERLAPMVRDLMAATGLGFDAVDRVGVTVGPGSFTGLRVGLAFAKGLALALNRPCVGVGTLAALAESVEGDGPLATAIDAGRGRLYLQIFDNRAPLAEAAILAVDAAIARLAAAFPSGDYVVAGPGAALFADAAASARWAAITVPDPRAVARLAASAPVATPRPLYLRPPDATAKAA